MTDTYFKYLYTYASFLCGHLDESIYWCQDILEHFGKFQNSLADNCKLLLGKSLARKYSQEQRLLEIKMDYFSAAEFGTNSTIKGCYGKARNAILNLGYTFDVGILDDDSSMLLDFAMMDYTREVNALNECSRCFLCRKRKKLHRSHICPESIFRAIAKESYKDSDPAKATVTSFTGRHEVKTPKSDTKWLLCGACENLLSRHGETQFLRFFRLLCPRITSTSISYDVEVYNFCVGISIRVLCLTNFSSLSNTTEIYKFLVSCRNHLISLSGDDHSLPSERKPEFFIFRNPIGLYSTEGVREDIFSGILDSHFQVHISLYHLHSGEKSPIAEGHFLLIILGGLMILAKFSHDQSFDMPESFVPILPEGGVFFVPDEVQRWRDIPCGVMEILKESVLNIQARISEVFWGKTPLSNKHKPTQLVPSWDTEVTLKPSLPISTELSNLQQELLSEIMQEEITKVNLLPEGFDINPPVSKVTLPHSHKILKHNHVKHATVLLAADQVSYYAIVIQQKNKRELTYGFKLQENEEKYTIKSLLVTSSVEGAGVAFLDGVVPAIIEVLESLWKDFGSFQGFIHHAEIER